MHKATVKLKKKTKTKKTSFLLGRVATGNLSCLERTGKRGQQGERLQRWKKKVQETCHICESKSSRVKFIYIAHFMYKTIVQSALRKIKARMEVKRYRADFMHRHEKRNVFNLDLKMSTFGDSLISTGSLLAAQQLNASWPESLDYVIIRFMFSEHITDMEEQILLKNHSKVPHCCTRNQGNTI